MGAAGIRRRKPVHHPPKVEEHYSRDEMARAFGNFRWSVYSPAGAVERAGFITRQTLRRRRHPEWNEYNRKTRLVGEALLVIPYAALAVFIVMAFVRTILDRL